MAFFYLCDCFKDFFYLSSYFCSSFLSTSVIVNILFLFNRFLYFSKKGPATFYGFKSFPNSLFLVCSGRLVSHSDWFVLNPASVLNQPRIEQKRELEAKKKKRWLEVFWSRCCWWRRQLCFKLLADKLSSVRWRKMGTVADLSGKDPFDCIGPLPMRGS